MSTLPSPSASISRIRVLLSNRASVLPAVPLKAALPMKPKLVVTMAEMSMVSTEETLSPASKKSMMSRLVTPTPESATLL